MLNSLRFWLECFALNLVKDPDVAGNKATKLKLTVTFEIDSEDNSLDSRGAFSREFDVSKREEVITALAALQSSYNDCLKQILRARWFRK